jgi:rhamnosyltransferase
MPNHANAHQLPKVTILLATHNGVQWLDVQLESLYAQADVRIHVVANDDHSTDGTKHLLDKWTRSHGLTSMPGSGEQLGSANRNFMKLLAYADIGDAEYVALSDQDDIWHTDKLIRAISQMKAVGVPAYSSNVEAFWPDGRRRTIHKSQAQKALDHVFSSPGPGCTFVFTRALFFQIQAWAAEHMQTLSGLWVHDWIIYAYVRGAGQSWLIDDHVSMQYRQHGANDIGANHGLVAVQNRLRRIRSGVYQQDLLAIARLSSAPTRLVKALDRLTWRDRLWLICRAHQFRRGRKEVVALMLFFLVLKRVQN